MGNEGLCRMLDAYKTRKAIAEVAFALCDGKETHVFTGSRRGSISKKSKGAQGFGWDPIFIPEGHKKTWAEMTDDEKHKTSMRKIALGKMKKYLKGNH